LDGKLDYLLGLTDSRILEVELGGTIVASVNLLNYVLSSAALTPGYTDRTITLETSRLVPFDAWMLDENWTLNQLGTDGTWRECFIAAVDRNPPPATRFPDAPAIRQAVATTRVLFTFGSEDAFLPATLQYQRAQAFEVPGRTEFRVLSGGHGAAFSAEGAELVYRWITTVLNSQIGGNTP
jgi:hypothetical protein